MSVALTIRESIVHQVNEWAKAHDKSAGAEFKRLFRAFEDKINFSFSREAYQREVKFLDIVQEHGLMGDLFDMTKTMFPAPDKGVQYEL